MSPYLESDLGARARARLKHHLAGCEDCTSVLRTLRHMLGRLRETPAIEPQEPAPQITDAVLRRLHEPAER